MTRYRIGTYVAAVVLVLATIVRADVSTWRTTTGNWSTDTNWTGFEPAWNDDAVISNGGTAQITSPNAENCHSLTLGNQAADIGTVQMSGGSLTVYDSIDGNAQIGRYGTGTFTQSGGTHTVGYDLYLGRYAGSQGTYTLSGGSLSTIGNFQLVGDYGTGTFTHSGGSNTTYDLFLCRYAGSSGTYNLSATGSLSAATEYVGISDTGTFTQSGGTNTIQYQLTLGGGATATGTYTLSAGSLSSGNVAYIGWGGTGIFTQTGGTHTAKKLYVGASNTSTGARGTYAISAGTLTGDDLLVGYVGGGSGSASGTFKVTGDDATIDFDSYTQSAAGTLISGLDAGGIGISLIDVTGTAKLDGTWTILDLGSVPLGTYDILTAAGGISGAFDTINLPNLTEWTWGLTLDLKTLWVAHVPEPSSLLMLAVAAGALLRRRF